MGIEERVGIEALGGMGQVGKAEVESKKKDDDSEVEGWWGGGAGKEDLEEGEDGIEGVNGDLGMGLVGGQIEDGARGGVGTYIGPRNEDARERRKENSPEDHGY